MRVPVVVAASVSPVKNPLVIDTVPETRFALSGSLTACPATMSSVPHPRYKRQTPSYC
jgi:hypothetical protein